MSYALIRFVHAIPNAGPIDVYLRPEGESFGYRVVSGIQYGEISEFVIVPTSKQMIDLRSHSMESSLPGAMITTAPLDYEKENPRKTLIIRGRLNDRTHPPTLTAFVDNDSCPQFNKSHIRVIHVAPEAPGVDFYDGNARIFSGITYGQTGQPPYVEVASGATQFTADISGTNKTILRSATMSLISQKIYTVLIMGNPGTPTNPLSAMIFKDDGKCL